MEEKLMELAVALIAALFAKLLDLLVEAIRKAIEDRKKKTPETHGKHERRP